MKASAIGFGAFLCAACILATSQAEAESDFGQWSADHAGQSLGGASLIDLDGKAVDLAAFGPKVLVHFWATWCGPCVTEMPVLIKTAKQRGVSLVLVSEDAGKPDLVKTFFDSHPMDLGAVLVVVDARFKLAKASGVATLPTTLVVDRGKEASRMVGMGDWLVVDGPRLDALTR